MNLTTIRLAALLALVPLSAIADDAAATGCAKSLSPAARMIYDATAASQPPDSALRDVVAAQTRRLVMAGRIERMAARPAAEAAGNCPKMTQQQSPRSRLPRSRHAGPGIPLRPARIEDPSIMELFHGPSAVRAFLPVLLIAIVVEGLLYWRRNHRYQWRDSAASLAIAVGHSLSGIVSQTVISAGLAVVVWRYRIATIDLDHWTNLVLLFLLVEFVYYWYHRAAHRVRLLWGSHSVHHSPEELTFAAAYRLNWTPLLSGAWLFFLPLVWVGFAPAAVFGVVSASLLYQFWLHTTLIPRLGPLEWVLNTPSAHRVHHASNPEYLDRNYGGTLIVFDRLFGTYRAEDPAIAIRFGLVHPVESRNPFVIVFHELAALLRDVWRAGNWRDRLALVFAPPGWHPADRGALGTTRLLGENP